eukprot:TRINITY_DN4737_c0_g2_i1.p1 TRINITY_DN4737_c0_g2~~TRINITY_DN4737_c0_g2_i1.p1  ORF type:complete len:603 (-),score=152.80 TRINITY_DN4737_c0_g2_i1:71-1747(-)
MSDDGWQTVETKAQKEHKMKEKKKEKERVKKIQQQENNELMSERQRQLNEMLSSDTFVDPSSQYSSFFALDNEDDKSKKKRGKQKAKPETNLIQEKIREEKLREEALKAEKKERQARLNEKKKQKEMIANQAKVVDISRLNQTLQDADLRFPSNVEVQLQILAEYFEVHISPVVKGSGGNVSLLPSSAVMAVVNWLQSKPEDDIDKFFLLILNIAREKQSEGLITLLQLLAWKTPFVLLDNTDELTELWKNGDSDLLLNIVKSKTITLETFIIAILLPIVLEDPSDSALSVAQENIASSIGEIWDQNGIGTVDVDTLTQVVSQFIEKKAENELPETLSFIYGTLVSPQFLLSGLSDGLSSTLFKTLLSHVGEKEVEDDVLDLLVKILEYDSEVYSVWRSTYSPETVLASNILVQRISSSLDDVHFNIPALIETIDFIIKTNPTLKGADSKSIKTSTNSAKKLREKVISHGNFTFENKKATNNAGSSSSSSPQAFTHTKREVEQTSSIFWPIFLFFIFGILGLAAVGYYLVNNPKLCCDVPLCSKLSTYSQGFIKCTKK